MKKIFPNLWQNPRIKAAIKLILWLVFILILVIIGTNFEETPQTPKEEQTTTNTNQLSTMQKVLQNDNYEYYYIIKTNNTTYQYRGKKTPTKEIGIKESDNTTIKYYIHEDTTYQVEGSHLTPITDLYAIINPKYLNIDYIFNLIEDLKPQEKEHEFIYELMIHGKNYQIIIKQSADQISEIIIQSELESYHLAFHNIGTISINNHQDTI